MRTVDRLICNAHDRAEALLGDSGNRKAPTSEFRILIVADLLQSITLLFSACWGQRCG
jgi:hypothetical protein